MTPEVIDRAVLAYQDVWNNWPKEINARNAGFVCRKAMEAALEAALDELRSPVVSINNGGGNCR